MSKVWHPGHIAKAISQIKIDLKNVDVIIEILDARCPISTKSSLIDVNNKKHLVILNKSDLSDENKNKFFLDFYKNKGFYTILLNSNNNDISKIIKKHLEILCKEYITKQIDKGIKNYTINAMVIGYPNVGKSTFINSFKNKKVQNVKNMPGVTKKNQWVKISDNIYLLDTPGITDHKFINDDAFEKLILINSINENLVSKQDICYNFLKFISKHYASLLIDRYHIDIDYSENVEEKNNILKIFDSIAKYTGCIKNNNVDYEKVSTIIINDFRSGKLGRITLDI